MARVVEPLRVGIYARISTHDQQTLPLQVKAMRQYARRHSWKVVKAVEDVGSGASERPQREELIKAARRRQIDAILVWRLDRLRELAHLNKERLIPAKAKK